MKKIQDTEDYPAVHPGTMITIEGYCMLNIEYGVVKTGIITGSIRIARSRGLKTSATIRKENRILIPTTVSVQSDLRVLNAGISHGAILMMKIMERKPGKNETGL